jgi:Uma2 family endonuclease
MTTAAARQLPVSLAERIIPPLESGDHLTAEEFERRYDAMPDLKKAELIQGVVFVPSPVSTDRHGEPHVDLITWLGFFKAHTPGLRGGADSTIRFDKRNEPQPDGLLLIDPKRGGRARIDEDGYVRGGPELLAEVSATTVSIDTHWKKEIYQKFGVQEYVIWRVLDSELDWYRLVSRRFKRLTPGRDGIFRSHVLPGLWLDAAALIAGDMVRVLDVLQQGLASPAHVAFVERLSSK